MPMNRGGWYGRTAINYQTTGKNYGIGGGTITAELYGAGGVARHWISRNITNIYAEYPNLDYLILEGGTNDADLLGSFDTSTQLGTWTPDDFSGVYDDTTFRGAVEQMFYNAITLFPKAKIGFIIPMPMGMTQSLENRRKYFNEIVKIANKWHINVLDLWNICGADPRLSVFYNQSLTPQENIDAGNYYVDGQHPTSVGYEKLYNTINKWLHTL